jgi:hypothetical protein
MPDRRFRLLCGRAIACASRPVADAKKKQGDPKNMNDNFIPKGEDVIKDLSPTETTFFGASFGHPITVAARLVHEPETMAALNEMLHRVISHIMLRLSGQEGTMIDAHWFDLVLTDAPPGMGPRSWIDAALL